MRLLPICKEHVSKGYEFVKGLTLEKKRDILKIVFKHEEAKSNLRVARANELLFALITPVPRIDNDILNDIGSPNAEDGKEGTAELEEPLFPVEEPLITQELVTREDNVC